MWGICGENVDFSQQIPHIFSVQQLITSTHHTPFLSAEDSTSNSYLIPGNITSIETVTSIGANRNLRFLATSNRMY